MSKEKKNGTSGKLVVCDVQEEYAEHLFKMLEDQLAGVYQFHFFRDMEKAEEFLEGSGADVLLIAEEYGELAIQNAKAGKKYVLTGDRKEKEISGSESLFRYQSAQNILKKISVPNENYHSRDRPEPKEKTRREKKHTDRSKEAVSGLIGVYSPIHRIGKTRFALQLGKQLAKRAPTLYINMEGYAGSYYFSEGEKEDLGDLLYCLKQERDDYGLKITMMAGQMGDMDYILPMKNEQDVRAVRKEEWISLLDTILEKCIYETVILDLGDAVDGLYDILRKCQKVYTLYIHEEIAKGKLAQYEENLKTCGYTDVLRRTVKRQAGAEKRQAGKSRDGQ